VIRFGDIDVDVDRREVRRAGDVAHLEPQAFDLLILLIDHRDRVLTKNELLDGVWGHRFVSDANLTTRVKEIRRAVGDDGRRQHTIRNIRGRGYRFVADVDVVGAPTPAPTQVGLIGRAPEIATVLDAITRSQVVTLTGPGGVGKSTLARAVAHRVAAGFGLGTRFVQLSTLDRDEHVLAALARSLDVLLDVDRPDLALRSIADLDVLVVLDNCEHVVDAVAGILDRLLTIPSSRIRIVATSQVRLGLRGEELVAVGPFGPDDALELFAERAVAVRPRWEIDAVGRDRVSTLLACLDRLPLTIEMAAARLGSLTFDELESLIGAETPVRHMTHRSPDRRHQSLDSLVTWSAGLLDPEHRRMFTEFSVFSGAVSVHDAIAVIGGDAPAAMFDLAALAERSLLVVDDDGRDTRFRMLATVRAVAANWLDDTERADEVRRRHAGHFTEVARAIDREIRTPNEAAGRRRLDAVAAELRSAFFWALREAPAMASTLCGALHLAAYSSFWNEPAEWSRLVLVAHPDADLDGARIVLAGSQANAGDLDLARQSIASVVHSDDARISAAAQEILADVALYSGDLDQALSITEQLHRSGIGLVDPHWTAIAAVDAALALTYGREPAAALARLDGLDIVECSPSDRAWLAYSRGEALSAIGDAAAIELFLDAIALARAVGNPFVTSVAQLSLAAQFAKSGHLTMALDVYSECLHGHVRHGNYVHAVTTLRCLVEVLVAAGDDHGAAVVAAATSSASLRPSYGPEIERLETVVHDLEERVGAPRISDWIDEGTLLDVPAAVRFAAQRVDARRR
jgi:predicted ATPase